MQPVSLLKAGEQPYFKTFGGTENRWGDFSATVVDPDGNLVLDGAGVRRDTRQYNGERGGDRSSFLRLPRRRPPSGWRALPCRHRPSPLHGPTTPPTRIVSWSSDRRGRSVVPRPRHAVDERQRRVHGYIPYRTDHVHLSRQGAELPWRFRYSNETTVTTLLATPANAAAVAASPASGQRFLDGRVGFRDGIPRGTEDRDGGRLRGDRRSSGRFERDCRTIPSPREHPIRTGSRPWIASRRPIAPFPTKPL